MINIKKGVIALLLTTFAAYSPSQATFVSSPAFAVVSAINPYESKMGYSLRYPKGWAVEEKTSPLNIAIFKSPLESKSDNFVENVNVVTEKAPGYTTEQYYQANMKSIKDNNTLSNFKILETGNKIIYGKTGKYIIYTHTYNKVPLKVKAYFFTSGQNGYVVTCTARPETFNSYLATFDNIVSTFKIIVNGIHM